MSLPIKATPTLNKKQTVEFVHCLWKKQDKKEYINLAESVKQVRKRRERKSVIR